MYHPDKHVTEEMKSKAEMLFNKIKKAHEGIHCWILAIREFIP